MYICAVCRKPTRAGEKANKVVVKTRPATYPYRKLKGEKDDPGGKGIEIAEEVNVGPCCFVTK